MIDFFLYFAHESFACMCVDAACECLLLVKARGGHEMPLKLEL